MATKQLSSEVLKLKNHSNCFFQPFLTVCFLPQRVVLALMGFLAIINAYTMRICLHIAITEMTINHNNTGSIDEGYCPRTDPNLDSSGTNSNKGKYEWSETLQGLILSSFYWGYTLSHIPAGLLAEKFGGKWCLSLGILSTAIFTLLTPLAIKTGGADLLITLRFFEGLGEGTTFPALSALLASWIPLKERSMFGSLVFGGGQVGAILGSWLSGVIIDAHSWEMVFYIFGVLGVLWFIFFVRPPEILSIPYRFSPELFFLDHPMLQRSWIAPIHQRHRKRFPTGGNGSVTA